MVEFGEELIMESYGIPLLIWIQLLVTILLFLLLLVGFSVFTSDPAAAAATGWASAGGEAAPLSRLNSDTPSNGIVTAEEHRTRTDGNSGEENRDGEGSSEKDSTLWILFRQPNHPCNYIRLAKQALFKCFGFDSTSSSNRQHEKCE